MKFITPVICAVLVITGVVLVMVYKTDVWGNGTNNQVLSFLVYEK